MHQISSDKFRVLQGNTPARFSREFSTGRKSNPVFINRKDTAVGNSNLMGIFTKILDGIAKAVKGFFDIRTPVFCVKGITERVPLWDIL